MLELSLELCAHMLMLANVDQMIEAARQRLEGVLDSGKALECLQSNIEAQGGDPRVCDAPGVFCLW